MKAEIVIVRVQASFVFEFTELEDEPAPTRLNWEDFKFFVTDMGLTPNVSVDIIRESKRSTPLAQDPHCTNVNHKEINCLVARLDYHNFCDPCKEYFAGLACNGGI